MIKKIREEKEIGLREMARLIGKSAALVGVIESGKSRPGRATLSMMCEALDLPRVEMFEVFEHYGIVPLGCMPETVAEFTLIYESRRKNES